MIATPPAAHAGKAEKAEKAADNIAAEPDETGKWTEILKLTQPSKELFKEQLSLVLSRQAKRADRAGEIITQITPQFAYYASICNLHPDRTRKTLELMSLALHFSMLITQRIKQVLLCPRPIEYSPLVQPLILTPSFSAYPSGHATEAYTFARIMSKLMGGAFGKDAENTIEFELSKLARRISDNRVYAGVHFPVDSAAGFVLAQAVSEIFLLKAGLGVKVAKRRLEADAIFADKSWDGDPESVTGKPDALDLSANSFKQSDLLAHLWKDAKDELAA